MEQFVKLLISSDYIPVLRRVTEASLPAAPSSREARLAVLRSQARDKLEGFRTDRRRAEVDEHYLRLQGILDASNDLNAELLKPKLFSDLLEINGPYAKGWQEFFRCDYTKAVDLLKTLYELECHYTQACK